MTAPQPQQKHPDDLFLITREELDRCYNQMSISGYKVSANYVEAMVLSRPHISTPTLPDEVCRICEDCRVKHDTAIRNSERERVLDKLFPKPDQDDLKNGWEYNYRFIEKIANRTEEMDEESSCMEQVMIVLKALEESLLREP